MSRPKNGVWKYIQFLTLHKRISSLHKTWLSLQHICVLKAHLYYVPVRLFLLNAWKKRQGFILFLFCLIQSHETETNQSHFKMYFTTQNSCTYILASSGLETQLTEAVGDGECYHLMLLYAYHISVFFCSWLLWGACWEIFLQPKQELKHLKLQWVSNYRE